jgi:hypothetical protein
MQNSIDKETGLVRSREGEQLGAGTDRVGARWWLGLAVGVLLLSGLLSISVVVGRLPVFARSLDPGFFRRCLVVHVDLALVIWFLAFLSALYALLPVAGQRRVSRCPPHGLRVALAGTALLLSGALQKNAAPVLSNYIPMLDSPVYALGIGLFLGGMLLYVLGRRALPGSEDVQENTFLPPEARVGVRAAALAFVIAVTTFGISALVTPKALPVQSYYELVFWGGGHVLQVAHEAAMVACWLLFVRMAAGEGALSRRMATVLFLALVLPNLAAPLLLVKGTGNILYIGGFTELMRYTIFPPVLIVLAACVRTLWLARQRGTEKTGFAATLSRRAFFASAGLTVLGFVLGAAITGHNTTVPAHYHAAIGAVTAAFMGMAYVLLGVLGKPLRTAWSLRWAAWQPLVFGGGQAIFAVGFGFAGLHGSARKVYGGEQAVRTLSEWVGLSVMGLGGLVAVVGGFLFIVLMIHAVRHRADVANNTPEEPGSF